MALLLYFFLPYSIVRFEVCSGRAFYLFVAFVLELFGMACSASTRERNVCVQVITVENKYLRPMSVF